MDRASSRRSCEHVFVHPAWLRQQALALIAAGLTDVAIARALELPRETVRYWRRRPPARAPCARCWRPSAPMRFSPAEYAELLGLYLGDGHISQLPSTQRIRLMLDAKYPTIVDEASALLARVAPGSRQLLHAGHMVTLHAYHGHWPASSRSTGAARSTTAGSCSSRGSRSSSTPPHGRCSAA
jgi:hypothetical protein